MAELKTIDGIRELLPSVSIDNVTFYMSQQSSMNLTPEFKISYVPAGNKYFQVKKREPRKIKVNNSPLTKGDITTLSPGQIVTVNTSEDSFTGIIQSYSTSGLTVEELLTEEN